MFIIKSIIYLNILSFIIAQNEYNSSKFHEENDPIIDPVELVLRSNDTLGIYHCTSRAEKNKQRNKLMASIDTPILSSPKFLLKTEQINASTIRIRIKPNGYIGVNRINCHWNNNLTNGRPADLIIGEDPGVIQLKERCQAFDRRYVECIFNASTIARGFRNDFPRLYYFSELNQQSLYRSSPILVNITNENELVFHFEPQDRNIIPKKVLMIVNMTLKRFGSSAYRFNIEPTHVTKVDYRIDDISNKQFTIYINHSNIGTISQRLCAGYVSRVVDQDTLTEVQDIAETSDQKIVINHLRSSTEYEICLRCFYEPTDQSFREKKCLRIKTITTDPPGMWLVLLISVLGVIALVSGSYVLFRRHVPVLCKKRSPATSTSQESDLNVPKSSDSEIANLGSRMKRMEYSSVTHLPTIRYAAEPTSDDILPLTGNTDDKEVIDQTLIPQYQSLDNLMVELTDKRKIAPDTYDFVRQENT